MQRKLKTQCARDKARRYMVAWLVYVELQRRRKERLRSVVVYFVSWKKYWVTWTSDEIVRKIFNDKNKSISAVEDSAAYRRRALQFLTQLWYRGAILQKFGKQQNRRRRVKRRQKSEALCQ